MSDPNGYASAADYFSEFRDRLSRELPEELPGSTATARLVGEYVGADKRSIMLFIKTGPTTVLSVRYKMPVPESGARVFGLEGLVPHVSPTFSAIRDDEIPGRTAAANMRAWNAEVARLTARQDEGTEKEKRAVRNILNYWRIMRQFLRRIYEELAIRPGVGSSGRATTLSAGGTEPRLHTPRPNSDPRPRSLTRTLSAPSSSSSRRSSSRRRTISRRRSDLARVRPRRFSGKPTSDPTRRRRRTAG